MTLVAGRCSIDCGETFGWGRVIHFRGLRVIARCVVTGGSWRGAQLEYNGYSFDKFRWRFR